MTIKNGNLRCLRLGQLNVPSEAWKRKCCFGNELAEVAIVVTVKLRELSFTTSAASVDACLGIQKLDFSKQVRKIWGSALLDRY